MTLNGVMAAVLRYLTESGSFGANYVTVTEVKAHTICNRNIAQRI